VTKDSPLRWNGTFTGARRLPIRVSIIESCRLAIMIVSHSIKPAAYSLYRIDFPAKLSEKWSHSGMTLRILFAGDSDVGRKLERVFDSMRSVRNGGEFTPCCRSPATMGRNEFA
jgi:hypothetical protein